jgi:toxin ParE1/3/4
VNAGCTLSRAADADLGDIYGYTRREFGKHQAERYLLGLLAAFDLIARHPMIGVEIRGARRNVRMYPHDRHVILYEIEEAGPFVIHIVAGKQRWQALLSDPA